VNLPSIVLWGFVATVVLSTILSMAQWLGYTRMSLPFLIGTMMTPSRDRAIVLGFFAHLLNGWGFSFLYALAFESWHRATPWLGAGIGLVHALFTLLVVLPLLPAFHPRMANEQYGPTPTRQLQPPGFMGLNYGRQTPIASIAAHMLYGAILGAFYRLAS